MGVLGEEEILDEEGSGGRDCLDVEGVMGEEEVLVEEEVWRRGWSGGRGSLGGRGSQGRGGGYCLGVGGVLGEGRFRVKKRSCRWGEDTHTRGVYNANLQYSYNRYISIWITLIVSRPPLSHTSRKPDAQSSTVLSRNKINYY